MIEGTYFEVLGTTIGASDRSKLGGNQVSGIVSSDGSFYGPNHGNLEGLFPGEGYPLIIS